MSDEAKPLAAPGAPEGTMVGRILADRYRVGALIGQGAMGRVYAAEHVHMHKPLALKILHAEHTKSPELVARFEREATAAANIDHPNVVSATDFGKLEDGTVYLALELVSGRSLRAEIAKGALVVGRALLVARQVASALVAAHARGIVHRDLKPENIVLVEKDVEPDFVKVLDFGIAKVTLPSTSPLTKLGVVLGTRDYMAPEQALGLEVDARADLYSLGAVVYEMLCGKCPFEGQAQSAILGLQLTKRPPSLRARAPERAIPEPVEAFVMKLLAKERAERPASATAVLAELDELLASLPSGVPAPHAPPPAGGAEQARAAVNKPTFLPTDPLPSFTFPPLEEESKKLAQQVQRALTVQAPLPVAAAHGSAPAERHDASHWKARLSRARTRAIESLRALPTRVTDGVDRGAAWLEQRRAAAPAVLERPLRRVSSRAIIVVLAAVLLGSLLALFTLLVVALVGRPDAPAVAARAASVSPVSPESSAPSVVPHGPTDGRGLAALARAETELATGNWAAVVNELAGALELDPGVRTNPRVAEMLGEAARRRASSATAFRLLGGPMEEPGAEVLYDLAAHPKTPRDVRTRAEEWLGSESFRRVASPALAIAGELRSARGCSQKRTLLARAGKTGDRRALEYLKVLSVPGGCGRRGRDDCFPCLRKDDSLATSIAEIEQRLAKGSP